MGVVKDVGTWYLVSVNGVAVLVGLGLLGLGLYMSIEERFIAGIPFASLGDLPMQRIGFAVAGAIILLLSCAGYCGAMKENGTLLIVYNIFVGMLTLLLLGAGSFGFAYYSALSSVGDAFRPDSVTNSTLPISEGLSSDLSDGQLALFQGELVQSITSN
jgi:hypothetical protein